MEFQYILCCGSTQFNEMGMSVENNFNTSYVVVQRTEVHRVQEKAKQFQYILCCGSTQSLGCLPILQKDFNTSYVVVQRFGNRKILG